MVHALLPCRRRCHGEECDRRPPGPEDAQSSGSGDRYRIDHAYGGGNTDASDTPVRASDTVTQDLRDLADRFEACGVTSVAVDSTGVYVIPAFEVLKARGSDVILVNARYAKNVPGRKNDVSGAGWLRQLHTYGLLRGSFCPGAEIATLRAYLRQRERLTGLCRRHDLGRPGELARGVSAGDQRLKLSTIGRAKIQVDVGTSDLPILPQQDELGTLLTSVERRWLYLRSFRWGGTRRHRQRSGT